MPWNDHVADAKQAFAEQDDFSDYEGPVLWEPGWYAGKVLEVDDTVSRSGHDMMVVTVGVVNQTATKKLTGRFTYGHPNAMPKQIAGAVLGSLVAATGEESCDDWVGKDVVVKLKNPRNATNTDAEGREWRNDNDIAGFKPLRKKQQSQAVEQILEDDIPFAYPLFYFGQDELAEHPRWGAR